MARVPQKYLQELKSPEAAEALEQLREIVARESHVTLVFASKELEHNNATVVKELVEGKKKPPKSAGATAKAARARRNPK